MLGECLGESHRFNISFIINPDLCLVLLYKHNYLIIKIQLILVKMFYSCPVQFSLKQSEYWMNIFINIKEDFDIRCKLLAGIVPMAINDIQKYSDERCI
jgi:hypothetical protein